MIYVLMYLGAIVAANLTVAAFGPAAIVVNAFLFVGLDLTARDRLHEQWQGNRLISKMALLLLTGSALTWLINRDAGRIALASMLAFCAAGVVDALVYQALRRRPRWQRVNGSNVLAAFVDSLLFPTLAFGVVLPGVILGQFAAKVMGGAVWAGLLGGAGVFATDEHG